MWRSTPGPQSRKQAPDTECLVTGPLPSTDSKIPLTVPGPRPPRQPQQSLGTHAAPGGMSHLLRSATERPLADARCAHHLCQPGPVSVHVFLGAANPPLCQRCCPPPHLPTSPCSLLPPPAALALLCLRNARTQPEAPFPVQRSASRLLLSFRRGCVEAPRHQCGGSGMKLGPPGSHLQPPLGPPKESRSAEHRLSRKPRGRGSSRRPPAGKEGAREEPAGGAAVNLLVTIFVSKNTAAEKQLITASGVIHNLAFPILPALAQWHRGSSSSPREVVGGTGPAARVPGGPPPRCNDAQPGTRQAGCPPHHTHMPWSPHPSGVPLDLLESSKS